MRLRLAGVCLLLSLCSFAQQATTEATVPRVIRISGQLRPASGVVGVTFSLYRSQADAAPLWTETQNIKTDANGKYIAVVGVTKAEGIPLELFANSEAQWLGIRQEGKPEQPRILLVSVPYAMKAAEAETLAGHTASEFVTQQNLGEMVQLKLQEPEVRTVLANPFVTSTTPATAGATNFTDSTANQILLVTQNSTGKLIVGEGPSHTSVFSIGQAGDIHGTGLSLDASASRTINMGNNPVSGGGGYGLVIEAGLPASGTANKRGGELVLSAGTGTGDGGSGDVVIRTAPPEASGTAGDTLITRKVYASSPVNMGGASGLVFLAKVKLPANSSAVLRVHFRIHATDESAHTATASGDCTLLMTSDSGALVSLSARLGADYAENSYTGDTVGAGCVPGEALSVYDSLSFTPTVHTITYELENLSELPLVLEYNTSSADRVRLAAAPKTARIEEPPTVAAVSQTASGAPLSLKLNDAKIRAGLTNRLVSNTAAAAGATNFTDSTANQILLVTQNSTGKLIVGEGPSHTPVFSVDEVGVLQGTGLTLDASASRSISMGNNPTSGGGGNGLVIEAGLPAYGTANKRGGELVLAAGTGTGDGGSGDVAIRTAAPQASGTAGDTLTTRQLYASSPVSMGGAVGSVILVGAQAPAGHATELAVRFKIEASDGNTNFGVAGGTCTILGMVSPNGSFKYGQPVLSDYAQAASSSNFNTTCSATYDSTNSAWAVQIADFLDYTPTRHTITYEVSNVSEWPLFLYKNTSSADKMALPKLPPGVGATSEHPRGAMLKFGSDGEVTVAERP